MSRLPPDILGKKPRLLSAQAAARYLGVPYTSLRDWALRGHVPIVRVPDCRRLWFDRRDLDRAIEAWRERVEVAAGPTRNPRDL